VSECALPNSHQRRAHLHHLETKPKKPRKYGGPREKSQKSSMFYSRLDVAKLIGMSHKGVKDIEKEGKLTPYKFGRRTLRYPAAEVHRLIEEARVK
jgi:DNA-binding XRE family transcriptional regulator